MAHITKKSNVGGRMQDVVKFKRASDGKEVWLAPQNAKRLIELGGGSYVEAPKPAPRPTPPPPPPAPRPRPAPAATLSKTTYADLEDRGGIIYNIKTKKSYADNIALAKDLRIAPHQLDWGQITKQTTTTPATQTAQGVSQWKNKWQNIKGITGFVRIGGAVYAVGPGGQPVGSEAELAWITEQTGKPLTANQVQKIPASQAAQYGIQLPGQPSITPSTIPSEETLTGEVVDSIPSELEDNEFFQQLDPEMQGIARIYWDTLESQSPQMMDALMAAMETAMEQAGPYWRERINILTDEIQRSLGTLEADLESRESSLSKRIQRINEDLEYEREHLSVSEQAELKRIKGEYEVEIENTRSTMAERGLSSSTIRTKAEERMATRQTDIVESTQRVYARAQRSLGLGSARSIEDIETEVEDLKRRTTEQKTDIGRKTEAYLGSEEAQKIPGLSDYLAGDITGTLGEQKGQNIWNRTKNLMGLTY